MDDRINDQWAKLEKYAKALDNDYIPYDEVLNSSVFGESADLIGVVSAQADFTRNLLRRMEYLSSSFEESM